MPTESTQDETPRFLLTNDDGWDALGLQVLQLVVEPHGRTIRVAPSRELSGCSHQTNTADPIAVHKYERAGYYVNSTPADCVRLGLRRLAPNVEWVVSGINSGGNLGVDVFLSGTVAAAREAALHGLPAIAISQYRRSGRTIDWERTGDMARTAIEAVLHRPLPSGAFWNVNLPDRDDAARPEVVVCPLDPRPLHVDYDVLHEQSSRREYSFRGVYQQRGRGAGTDVDVCFRGDIAISMVTMGQAFAALD